MTVTLALYPNARGLGYACVAFPDTLLDYGIITLTPIQNEPLLARIEKFIDFFKPDLVVTRKADSLAPRGDRIKELIASIEQLARKRDIAFHSYALREVKEVFELFGALTKYEIANNIIKGFPDLAARAPQIRKPWMPEDYNMGIFDAIALAGTHNYLHE